MKGTRYVSGLAHPLNEAILAAGMDAGLVDRCWGHRASRSLPAGYIGIVFMRGVDGLYVENSALLGIGGVGFLFARFGMFWIIGLGEMRGWLLDGYGSG